MEFSDGGDFNFSWGKPLENQRKFLSRVGFLPDIPWLRACYP